MGKKDMTFAEIQANKEAFLQQYEVAELFPKCGVSWETLMEIGNDYETKCYGDGRESQEYRGDYFKIIQSHIAKIASFMFLRKIIGLSISKSWQSMKISLHRISASN